MKYQTHVEDIIINNDNYEIVTDHTVNNLMVF